MSKATFAIFRTDLSPEIKRQLASDPPVPELTPRQLDILRSMTQGLTNKDIAKQLKM